jgi:hypothetical protein
MLLMPDGTGLVGSVRGVEVEPVVIPLGWVIEEMMGRMLMIPVGGPGVPEGNEMGRMLIMPVGETPGYVRCFSPLRRVCTHGHGWTRQSCSTHDDIDVPATVEVGA